MEDNRQVCINYFNEAKVLVNKCYWGFHYSTLEELNEHKCYKSLKLILNNIETNKSLYGSKILLKVPDIDDVENSADNYSTDEFEKIIKEKHLHTLGVFMKNDNFKKDLAISKIKRNGRRKI
uniref:Uncharacterized protein n=1 Tax=Meloidogyne enterolobii TaxID=390850 RepID=A0A6V7UX23_MELEN|nr:unnamed protein product [Meloidogyne enterolobii]